MHSELNSIHDILFKKSLENPEVAYDFLKAHLPIESQKYIDLTSLKIEKVVLLIKKN